MALGAALSLSLPALAEVPTIEEVVAIFSGIEQTAPEPVVRAWGPNAIATLTRLAEDPARPEFVRARATTALRVFAPSPAAHTALLRLANASSPHPLVLRAALTVLASDFADLSLAQRMLRAASSETREGAVWALSRSPLTAAREALLRGQVTERDPAVRATYELVLRSPTRGSVVAQPGPIRTR